MKQKTKSNIIIIFSILIVAILGSIFVQIGMNWYETLYTPKQWVPSIVIPIVWSVIYILCAVVLLVWNNRGSIPKSVTILFIINGILNILWCLVFFTFRLTLVGNITILINLIFAVILVLEIFKFKNIFGVILSIYPVWVLIATTLNTALWILN